MNNPLSSAEFWADRYASQSGESSGVPGSVLVRFAEHLSPGQALELGCARGDDAVWLACRGWQVTAVDIAQRALDFTQENARRNGVLSQLTLERHDLSETFPQGEFDLVTASFLESPVEFGRYQVLRSAAGRVKSGGMLLITSHGSVPSWSEHKAISFPTPEAALAELALDEQAWITQFVGNIERPVKGPDGKQESIQDTVLALIKR